MHTLTRVAEDVIDGRARIDTTDIARAFCRAPVAAFGGDLAKLHGIPLASDDTASSEDVRAAVSRKIGEHRAQGKRDSHNIAAATESYRRPSPSRPEPTGIDITRVSHPRGMEFAAQRSTEQCDAALGGVITWGRTVDEAAKNAAAILGPVRVEWADS